MEFPCRYGTFDKLEAEEIAKEYKADVGQTEWKFIGTEEPDPDRYDVVFRNVESYAQYLADKYGEKGIDARIFYKDGKIIEIKSK